MFLVLSRNRYLLWQIGQDATIHDDVIDARASHPGTRELLSWDCMLPVGRLRGAPNGGGHDHLIALPLMLGSIAICTLYIYLHYL